MTVLSTFNRKPTLPTAFTNLSKICAHKWLGCMISTHTDGSHGLDLEHHLQVASSAFYANKSILSDKSVSIAHRLVYFDAMVTPVACFASGHRKIYKQDFRKLDVKFRKLVRTIVGPPGGLDWSAPWHHIFHEWTLYMFYKQDLHRFDVLQRRLLRSVVGPPRNVDWTQPWHEILHHWNERIQQLKCKPWSEMCLQHHWILAHYFALLPDHRWFKRVLHWNPCGRRRVGRPKNSWDTILENFCRLKGLPSWEVAAMDQDLWSSSPTFLQMIMYI